MKRKNSEENTGRNYSWAILPVLILIIGAAIAGIIAYAGDIRANARQKAIEEYANSVVNFTVFGEGKYMEEDPVYNITVESEPVQGKTLMGEFTDLGMKTSRKLKTVLDPKGDIIISVETAEPDKAVAVINEYGLPFTCEYVRKDALLSVGRAYDAAYEAAINKANMIANNTGLPWSIKNVTELECQYDAQSGTTYSKVSMTLAVDGFERFGGVRE